MVISHQSDLFLAPESDSNEQNTRQIGKEEGIYGIMYQEWYCKQCDECEDD